MGRYRAILQKILQDRETDLLHMIASGKPVDFAEYKSRVGEITGIRFALSALGEAESQISQEGS